MTQNIDYVEGDILQAPFTHAIQELLGAAAPQFQVVVKNGTTLELVATTENGQQSIAINGRYRWRTTSTTAALPGGLPDGTHPVFVTASDNDFSGPPEEPDEPTNYGFGLEIKEAGHTPSSVLWRQVGTVTVASSAITGFEQTVGGVGAPQIASSALSSASASDITWTRSGNAWVANLKPSRDETWKTLFTADTALGASGGAATRPMTPLFRLPSGDYNAIHGMEPEFRIIGGLLVNGTAPGGTWTGLLAAVEGFSAGAPVLSTFPGLQIAGPSIATPTSGVHLLAGTEQPYPGSISDGLFALAMKNSATTAAGSETAMHLTLQVRWVAE